MGKFKTFRRPRKLYVPGAEEAFELSRSKVELFLDCSRCFYLDRRHGIGRPSGPPFTLNSAVDTLLKKEFDIHRAAGTVHPLLKHYGLTAVPAQHPELPNWRHNFTGIRVNHEPTNFIVYGAIDDLWKDEVGNYIVVDYKATSKLTEVNLDAEWQISYKRQMEFYQWLLRGRGLKVSDTGYFVYCNGKTDREAFDGKLEFDIKLIPYTGNDGWISETLVKARACLEEDLPPVAESDCEYCSYRQNALQVESQ